ncbi:hypothetical protein RIMD111065_24460 [Aeromonas hydrophila]|nr:hypothetical protein [Aeromonas hydrophila]BCO14090.1 hypothetical protein RIMD111065_24460 [Aeromonas hydrophila]
MTLTPGSGQVALGGALSAERVTDLTSLLAKGALCQQDEISPLAVLTALAIHIEQYRLDRTLLPVNLGREQLMIGAADLLGEEACVEDQDAFCLLALLFDKLQRGGRGSRQIKLDGLTPSVME